MIGSRDSLRHVVEPRHRKRSPFAERLESRIALSTTPLKAQPAPIERPYSSTEVVIAFRADQAAASQSAAELLSRAGAEDRVLAAWVDVPASRTLFVLDGSPIVQVALASGANPLIAVDRLAALATVEWAAPNYLYTPEYLGADPREFTPNDPQFGSQYHHATMQNDLAWNTTLGSPDIIVAITDDGVQWNHPDLAPNIWTNTGEIAGNGLDDDGNGYIDDIRGWDFSSNDNNPTPVGADTHGTHVAGIAAARTNNATGVAGTAGGSTIMPLRFYGSGAWTSTVIANSYAYAANNGAQIVSTSYNVDGFVGDPTFEAALNYLHNNGVLHFNSAGNNSELNPARQVYDQSLYVASTTASDAKSDFSNYGWGIDVSAPGSAILSTLAGSTYGSMSGTSMATPNAAGVAALIWSAHPTWTRDQVAAALIANADNIDVLNPAFAGLLGSGRVNSYRSVTQAVAAPRIRGLAGIADGATVTSKSELVLELRNVLDATTAMDAANYELRSNGPDNVFGNADDVIIPLTVATTYRVGTNRIRLTMPPLLPETYRFRAISGGLRDPFGTALDGDDNGAAGGDFLTTFTTIPGYTAAATDFEPINLVAGAPGVFSIVDGEDDGTGSVNLTGSPFNFFGVTYSTVFASSNGLITFGSASNAYDNTNLNGSPTQASIAPLWDDLRTDLNSSDIVLGKFEDTNSDTIIDRLIIEWSQVQHYPNTTSDVTFQAILQLNTGSTRGAIVFNYPDIDFGTATFNNGANATVGIKNSNAQGGDSLLVSYNSGSNPLIGSGKAIRIAVEHAAVQPDLQIVGGAANGTNRFELTYTIASAAASAFEFALYKSADTLFDPGDMLLAMLTISDPADLSLGTHVKLFDLGSGPGQVPWPGFGAPETDDDYHLLTVLDPANTLPEADLDPINEDNLYASHGVYHSPGGLLYIQGHSSSETYTFAIAGSDLALTIVSALGSVELHYNVSDLTSVRIRMHDGHDLVQGAALSIPMYVLAGPGDDSVNGGSGPDTLYGGDGNDSINGGSGVDTLSGGLGVNVLNGGTGADTLIESIEGASVLSNTSLVGQGSSTLSAIENAVLTGGPGSDSFNIGIWNGGVTLNGGGGTDAVVVDRSASAIAVAFTLTDLSLKVATKLYALNSIEAAILTGGTANDTFTISAWSGSGTISGGSSGNDIVVSNQASNPAGVTFTLDNAALSRTGAGIMALASIEVANLTGGTGIDTFNVGGWTGTGTLVGGSGTVDALNVTRDADFTLASNLLASPGFGNVALSGIEVANLTGGASDNRFDVSTWAQSGSIDGGGGVDTIMSNRSASASATSFALADAILTVGSKSIALTSIEAAQLSGGTGNDTFTVSNWNKPATLTGGSGTDRVVVSRDLDITLTDTTLTFGGQQLAISGIDSANLTGGDGNNRINAAGFSGPVTLSGGAGNDILVGGAGNDSLLGGNGLDLLIGGTGLDTLLGGNGEDLLIAGAASFATNINALDAILAEWTSGTTYAIRVANLIAGNAASGRPPLDSSTVANDGGADRLTGNASQDWFVAAPGDTVTDQAGNETKTVL